MNVQAVLASRLEDLTRRRALLEARMRGDDLRSVVEAHQLPLMELAEDENCYYLPFLEQLLRYSGRDQPLDTLPAAHVRSHHAYIERVGLIEKVPYRLRGTRIYQSSALCLHACADRHREQAAGSVTLSYAEHVSLLLDGIVAFIAAAPSSETLAALQQTTAEGSAGPSLRALP